MKPFIRDTTQRLTHPLVAVLLSATAAFNVHAQQQRQVFVHTEAYSVGVDRGFKPALTRQQFDRYGRVLALNETQKLLADEMLAQYRRRFDERAGKVRSERAEIGEEAKATGDYRAYADDLVKIMKSWGRERDELEEELIGNLKSLLNEEQVEYWPLFEREKRRADLLPNARLGGEDVDLIALVQGLEVSEETEEGLAEVLEQYASQLDNALQARERTLESLRPDWRDAMMSDREEAKDIWKEATSKRSAVRNINRRTLRILMAEIDSFEGAQKAAELELAYKKKAYPLAYEPTRADRMLEQMAKLVTLSAEQSEQIAAIESDYTHAADGVRGRLISEILKTEGDLPPFLQHFESDGGMLIAIKVLTTGGDVDEGEYGGLLRDRYDLSKRTIERMKSVLTSDQREVIPNTETPQRKNLWIGRAMRFNL